MGRLTWKNPNGDWGIKGVEFSKLDGAVYGALCKLLAYENTGLSPDEVERLNDFEQTQCADLLAKLTQEREAHRWIPVAERLPGNGEIILITRKCRNGKWYAEQDEYYYETGFESGADEDIIAWMPMPEPHKEGT